MKKVTPFLWFDTQAQAAAKFYVSVFRAPRAKLASVTAMSASFTIDGQHFIAFNGGPHYKLTPAISLTVDCKTQAEIDRLWKKLLEGGTPSRCGWLTDRFGLSWQIVPSMLGKVLNGKDQRKSHAALQAMLGMEKLDIQQLQAAYDNG